MPPCSVPSTPGFRLPGTTVFDRFCDGESPRHASDSISASLIPRRFTGGIRNTEFYSVHPARISCRRHFGKHLVARGNRNLCQVRQEGNEDQNFALHELDQSLSTFDIRSQWNYVQILDNLAISVGVAPETRKASRILLHTRRGKSRHEYWNLHPC